VPRSEPCRNDFLLFSESNSRFLIEVEEKHREKIEELMKNNVYAAIGRIKKDRKFSVYGLNDAKVVDTSISELRNTWKRTFGG
jgi:phosphoribosylformylglycinamidine synthase